MKVIGLTGGIGSGKSTIAKMFNELGIPVYEADSRAKSLQNTEPLKSKITELFGHDIYVNDILKRKKLAEIVFSDKSKLQALNSLVHPAVAIDFSNWLQSQQSKYIIKEAAIIFEINASANYDKVILVTAPKDVRIERVMKRDKVSAKEVTSRILNQMMDEEKIPLADFVIQNVNLDETRKQVKSIHQKLLDNDN